MGMRLKQYLSVSIISTSTEWLIILLFQWKLQTETQEKNMEMTFLELSSKRRNFKLQEWMQSLWKRKERETERQIGGDRALDNSIKTENNFGRERGHY